MTSEEVAHPSIDNGKAKSRFPRDRWDPLLIHSSDEIGYRYFDRDAAAECVRHKRIFVAGDSTTRDTFYEFLAVSGHPIMNGMRNESTLYWGDNRYDPQVPFSSFGRDIRGQCLGNANKHSACTRDEIYAELHGQDTRLGFHFLSTSNATWEIEKAVGLMDDRAPDAAFVQCPFYEWFKPDSYNYSLSKEQRARVVEPKEVGPRHFEAIGKSCLEYFDKAVTRRFGLQTRLFMLGTSPLPGWTRDVGGADVERKVFNSLHRGLGIRCDDSTADGSWELFSKFGITPIDRYAIVGQRKRDGIHPLFNAQFAVVQLMLNHLCPMGGRPGAFVA